VEEPFAGTGRFAQLAIEHVELLKVSDPVWDKFQQSGDREAFAHYHARLTQAWAGPTIARLIESDDRKALVENLFTRFTQRIVANPRKHEPYMAVAVLKKSQ
jgi:hypothetical protein